MHLKLFKAGCLKADGSIKNSNILYKMKDHPEDILKIKWPCGLGVNYYTQYFLLKAGLHDEIRD